MSLTTGPTAAYIAIHYSSWFKARLVLAPVVKRFLDLVRRSDEGSRLWGFQNRAEFPRSDD